MNTHSVVVKWTTHRMVIEVESPTDLHAYIARGEFYGDDLRDYGCTYDCSGPEDGHF